MTSTVLGTEGGLRGSETVQDDWVGDLLDDWQGFRSRPRILVSHHGAGTDLPAPLVSPLFAGHVLPSALYYVFSWVDPFAEGSTGLVQDSPQAEEAIRDHLDRLIALSVGEVFFDGMESRLSFGLKHLLGVGGVVTVKVIRSLLNSERLSAEEVGEILRVLGDFEDSATHGSRLSVLLDCLRSKNSRVRDAASIGIASLDDPTALQEVEAAVKNETLDELRHDLQMVVDQLRAGLWRHS